MLSIGWKEQLTTIFQAVPQAPHTQTLLFSATFPASVDEAASQWVHNAVRFTVQGTGATIGRELTQVVHLCSTHKKPRKLLRFIAKVKEEDLKEGLRQRRRTLIFVNKIKTAKFVLALLERHLNGVTLPSGKADGATGEEGKGARRGRGGSAARRGARGGRATVAGKKPVRIAMLHGKLAQHVRQRILANFKGT